MILVARKTPYTRLKTAGGSVPTKNFHYNVDHNRLQEMKHKLQVFLYNSSSVCFTRRMYSLVYMNIYVYSCSVFVKVKLCSLFLIWSSYIVLISLPRSYISDRHFYIPIIQECC